MLYVANAGAMPLRTRRHCEELVSWVTRLVLCVALVSCKQPTIRVDELLLPVALVDRLLPKHVH